MKTHPGYDLKDLVEFRIDGVYMFPVAKGTWDYVDGPTSSCTGRYYSTADGWCVSWREHEKWFKHASHQHTGMIGKHQMFLDKYAAEGLHARLLLGLEPLETDE